MRSKPRIRILFVTCVTAAACRAPLPRPAAPQPAILEPTPTEPPASAGDEVAGALPIRPCAAANGSASSPATIDDFEESAPSDAWFSYNDGTTGGELRRAVESIEPGRHALHVTAAGWHDWGAGVSVQLGPTVAGRRGCAVDASANDGIRFRARGTGTLRVNLTTPPLIAVAEGGGCSLGRACYDWPGADVSLTPEWTTFELRFCALAPVGWGRTSAPVDASRLYALHFRLSEGQAHDVWLDDVAFLPHEAARDSERCGPTCPRDAAPRDAIVAPARLAPEAAAAGVTVHTFEQPTRSCGALVRRYLTYVPSRLAARSPAPVLIALHGYGSSAESFRAFQTRAGFEPLADRDGFIVVYANAAPGPATSARVPNSGAWSQPPSPTDEVDDVAYLGAVLDDLKKRGVVDGGNAVFLVGQSNGGGMVIEAARQRPDRYGGFAALMPYAGPSPRAPEAIDGARLARVLFVYSAADPGLPDGYGATLRALASGWAAALGVPAAAIAAPKRTALPDLVREGARYTGTSAAALATRDSRGEVLDMRAPGTPPRAALRVIAFDRAGHFWPHPVEDTIPFVLDKWGLRNQDIDAADAVWSFFRDTATAR